jgi:hypothetical protein
MTKAAVIGEKQGKKTVGDLTAEREEGIRGGAP